MLEAALALFAEHGVSGTSLQMIADHLGVTKAAVYYQFRAKEDIVLAVLEPALATLAQVADAALAEPTPARRRAVVLEGIVDLMLAERERLGAMNRDPAMERVLAEDAAARDVVERVTVALVGEHPDPQDLVAASVLGAGLGHAVIDPTLADLGTEQLRDALLRCARSLLPSGRAHGRRRG